MLKAFLGVKSGAADREKSELEKKEQSLVELKKELEAKQLLLEKHQQIYFSKIDEQLMLNNRLKYLTTCTTEEQGDQEKPKKADEEKDADTKPMIGGQNVGFRSTRV